MLPASSTHVTPLPAANLKVSGCSLHVWLAFSLFPLCISIHYPTQPPATNTTTRQKLPIRPQSLALPHCSSQSSSILPHHSSQSSAVLPHSPLSPQSFLPHRSTTASRSRSTTPNSGCSRAAPGAALGPRGCGCVGALAQAEDHCRPVGGVWGLGLVFWGGVGGSSARIFHLHCRNVPKIRRRRRKIFGFGCRASTQV